MVEGTRGPQTRRRLWPPAPRRRAPPPRPSRRHPPHWPWPTIADNHRFLVTDRGEPFFWLGDTAWWILRLTDAEIDEYLGHKPITAVQNRPGLLVAAWPETAGAALITAHHRIRDNSHATARGTVTAQVRLLAPPGLCIRAQGCGDVAATLGQVWRWPPTPTGLRPGTATQPLWGRSGLFHRIPRVVRRGGQPWALVRSPFGAG